MAKASPNFQAQVAAAQAAAQRVKDAARAANNDAASKDKLLAAAHDLKDAVDAIVWDD
jgi:hypothetical protein